MGERLVRDAPPLYFWSADGDRRRTQGATVRRRENHGCVPRDGLHVAIPPEVRLPRHVHDRRYSGGDPGGAVSVFPDVQPPAATTDGMAGNACRKYFRPRRRTEQAVSCEITHKSRRLQPTGRILCELCELCISASSVPPHAIRQHRVPDRTEQTRKRVALNSPPVVSFSPHLCVIGSAMPAAAVYVPDDAEMQSAQRPQRNQTALPLRALRALHLSVISSPTCHTPAPST